MASPSGTGSTRLMDEVRAALADPANAESPLRPLLAALAEENLRLSGRLEKITRISDRYQLQIRDLNRELEATARTDSLTGLPNRRDMQERLSQELALANRQSHTFSLLLIDIDHFGRVNQTYGHEVGDQALAAVASTLDGNVRASDVCSRWGGEEFLVLLPLTKQEEARAVAERLREQVQSSPVVCQGASIPLTVSVGVHMLRGEESPGEALRAVEHALQAAKEAGRNCVRVSAT